MGKSVETRGKANSVEARQEGGIARVSRGVPKQGSTVFRALAEATAEGISASLWKE